MKLTTTHVDQLLLPEYLPWRPKTRLDPMYAAEHLARTGQQDVEYRRHGDLWHLEITFGKVQPGATIWTEDELLIGNDPRARGCPGWACSGTTSSPSPWNCAWHRTRGP